MTWRDVPTLTVAEARLQRIFPREAFDSAMSNPLASKAVVAMIYLGAVAGDEAELDASIDFVAPRHVLWLSEQVIEHVSPTERSAWHDAASRRRHRGVRELELSWGLTHEPWHVDNTREGLRDETLPKWLEHGAVRLRHDVKQSSQNGRWVMSSSFADLFDPEVVGDDLDEAISSWQQSHMTTGAKVRIQTLQRRQQSAAGVSVTLPGSDEVRHLAPGESSFILKAILEDWAPRRLGNPEFLALSDRKDNSHTADHARLVGLGIVMDSANVLPDAVIVDIAPDDPQFWIIEAVATDGEINEPRRQLLLQWADDQGIPIKHCKFMTAFSSRNSGPARKRLKDLAVGTYAWFVDEPGQELVWREIGSTES